MSAKDKIIKIILENSSIDESERPADIAGLSLSDDLEYDSLCFMNMIVDLETELGISFDDTELLLENLDDCTKLIGHVLELIKEKQQNGGVA